MNRITRFIRNEDLTKQWYLVDAKDKVLGRLCSNIAKILRGKHKPSFTPNSDNGDFVIVINADKIRVTGNKTKTKSYQRFSGYPGGLKTEKYKEVLDKHPERIIMHAVKGMLPDNKLRQKMIKKLKIYTGTTHPHQAQNPLPAVITKD